MTEINRDQLSDEFDIDNIETEVKEMVKQFDESEEADVEEILLQNVNRANRVLDRIEHEIGNGNFSSRISEVASQLINSVTNAATQISADRYNTDYLQLRRSIVQLEKMKLELKKNESSVGKANVTNQNIIVTDRESLLKFLKGEKEKAKKLKPVEQKQIEEKGGKDE
jgi:hypothetical protein